MSVSVTSARVDRRGDGLYAKETLTQGTAVQAIALTTDLTTLSGGTATGFDVDAYALSTASAVEGQVKEILMLATGEANVILGNGTATGRLVFTAADDFTSLKFLNGGWRIINTTATFASST